MSLRDFFLGNFKTKALALVMAACVWAFAYYYSRKTMPVTVPLEVHKPENWTLSEDAPRTVRAQINYPLFAEDRIREALRTQDLACKVDVVLADDGRDEFDKDLPITPDCFRLPPGSDAQVTSVDPASVRLHFAREQTRTDVPVEVAVGDPPPGHTVESVWPWPRRVSVRGPKRDVSGLQKVLTRRVTLDDGPPPKSMKIEGKAPVETGKKSIKCAETVEYTIYLARKSMKRRFEKTPIQFLMPPKYPYDVKLAAGSDDTLDIEVTGPENVIKDMKPEDVLLFVVVNRLTRPGQKEYLRVEWRIAGVSPTESVTIEGLKEEVPVEAVARPRTTP